MKINYKQLQAVVIGLALLLVAFAILNATHVLELEPETANKFSTWVMLGGLAIFVWSRKLRKEEEAEKKMKEDAKKQTHEDENGSDDARDQKN